MNRIDLGRGLEEAWASFMTFMPKLLLAVVILIAGYFLAKLACKVFDAILERVGFDRLVERGGVKKALAKTKYDASSLLAKLLFYGIMLLVLQFAFGIFGPNPVSTLLTSIIAFLPNLFVAVLIVIIASAVAAAVKDILQATLGGLSYGRMVSNLVAALIIATGVFAALDQINIAPAIVNGLFYAMLAIIAGSAIIAVGGGGIVPMRAKWERVLNRVEQEAPQLRAQVKSLPDEARERSEVWKSEAQRATHPSQEQSFSE